MKGRADGECSKIKLAGMFLAVMWPALLLAVPGGRTDSVPEPRVGTGGAAAGVLSRETRSLSGDRMSLSVSLEETSGGVRFVLDSMTDPMTGIELNMTASPIWQVMLADGETAPPGTRFPPDSDLLEGSVVVPAGQAGWGSSEPGSLVLRWSGLEVPGGQTLDVEVSIRLRDSDGFAEWRMTAQLSDGDLMLVSTAFPLLDLPGIGESSSDDTLFHPALGGSRVGDPVGCGRFLAEFSSITGDPEPNLVYPGELASQFMSLYDHDLGLYLAAEDPAGSVKGLVYSITGGRLRLWFRNDNTTAYDPSRAVMAAALRRFDLSSLGYPVVTGVYHGDWMDAADLYRSWAVRAGVPFLAQGPVTARDDIGEKVKSSALLIRYSFGFLDTPVVLDEDEARLEAAIDFFREHEPDLGIAVSFVGVIQDREDADIPRESWYGSAGRPELDGELKDGVAEMIDWLMTEHGIPSGHNRDTGNWRLEEGSTEAQIFEQEDVLHRAIVRRWDGTPHRKSWSEVHRSVCGGSQWQLGRRLAIRTATVLDSRGSDGDGPGFQFLILSGQGTVPKLCYAPLLADNHADEHQHPVGGGSWWQEHFSSYAASLRMLYGEDAPFYTVIPEREHEQLIGVPGLGYLGGKGRQYPFSDDNVTQAGGGNLACSQPVPLSMYLYHDRVLQGTQSAYYSDYIDAFGASYGSGGQLVPHPNYYRAMAALSGRTLSLLLRSDRLGAGEDPSVDGPFFSELSSPIQQDWEFLRLLLETRHRNLEHLAWGRMLRFPTVETDIIHLEAYRDGQLRTYPVKTVVASAFKASDGTIKLFAANHTREARSYTLSFDPARYGIGPGSCWRLERLDPGGDATLVGQVCGDTVYTSPAMSMAPLSVQVFSLKPMAPAPRHPSGRALP